VKSQVGRAFPDAGTFDSSVTDGNASQLTYVDGRLKAERVAVVARARDN
jgi:hypothetical protein